MQGVSFKNCRMHNSNRPSLGSWQRWPWEWNLILPRAFKPFRAANIQIAADGKPEDMAGHLFPEDMLPAFVKIYDCKGTEDLPDVGMALIRSKEAGQASSAKTN
jgi:hypothetical protein